MTDTSHTLLLAAHGTRLEPSNEEVRQLTALLREKVGERFARVECAFLELTKPSLSDVIDQVIAEGSTNVTVLPYFLVAGRHVAKDIPDIVNEKRTQYPGVRIQVTDYFGSDNQVPHLLAALAIAAGR